MRASVFQSGLIAGALLVAPAEPLRFGLDDRLPQSLLPFPTTLVASTNDPHMTADSAAHWAGRWGSELVTLQGAGHINVKAGFEDWALGLELLESLCRRVIPAPPMRAEPGSPRSRSVV